MSSTRVCQLFLVMCVVVAAVNVFCQAAKAEWNPWTSLGQREGDSDWNLLNSLRAAVYNGYGGGSSAGSQGGTMLNKRQNIRYHQCYFNPVSCFRRRK